MTGLAVMVPLHRGQLAQPGSVEAVHACLARHYEGERFVRVMPLRDPVERFSTRSMPEEARPYFRDIADHLARAAE